MRWGDVLRVKSEFPGNLWPNAVQAYHRWIRDSLRRNVPYDQFARDLLTSSGSNFIGISLNSAIFEGTVGNFQFGGGPSLDFLFGCSGTPVNANCGATPIFFGLDGRMALHFHPLTISFDVHPMFFRPDSMALLLMLGIGVDFE